MKKFVIPTVFVMGLFWVCGLWSQGGAGRRKENSFHRGTEIEAGESARNLAFTKMTISQSSDELSASSPAKVSSLEAVVQDQIQYQLMVRQKIDHFTRSHSATSFLELRGKVLFSDEEALQRHRALSDSEAVHHALGLLSDSKVVVQMSDSEFDQTLDFLTASFQESQGPEQLERILEFVANPELEKTNLSSFQIRKLAEAKGEVMYHLIASEPGAAFRLQEGNLGSRTKKVLENVLEEQARLLSESQSLLGAR